MKRTVLVVVSAAFGFVTGLASFVPVVHTGIEGDVLIYTNKFRQSQGLATLIIRDELNRIARQHSEDMSRGRVGFGHSGFSQRFSQAQRVIKGFRAFAENVAYGARSGQEVVNMWKTSPGHRRNMLGHYKYMGIGIAKDRRGTIYYTQVFAN